MMKIGFIGCGNMATAMIHGILQSGLASERDLMASAKTAKTQKKITDELHLACGTNEETASFSDVLFLAVKPQFYEDVILSVRDHVKKEALIVTEEELDTVLTLLSSFGKAEVIPENLIDVATAVSGSSPAYIFLAIEAMADGAVADGMPRNKAYRFAAQAVLGSAKMVLETGKHPGELKDMVCSPGGTTMEAVRVLEEKGLRSALIEAEKACVRKARAM